MPHGNGRATARRVEDLFHLPSTAIDKTSEYPYNLHVKYFQDFSPGEVETVGDHSITHDEIVQYGQAWDPQPIHVGLEPGATTELGGLVAAGTHLVAITVLKLVTHLPRVAIIAGLGWDEVRFHRPARPGDTLTVTRECLDVRLSQSRNDRGIVRNRITLTNQMGELVLSYVDAILVACRPANQQNTGGRPPGP